VTAQPSSHWFDRFTVKVTRRAALKGAVGVAGAAILGSAGRPQKALADDPNACRTGCNWTAHQTALSRIDNCQSVALTAGIGNVSPMLLLGAIGGFVTFASNLAFFAGGGRCTDNALIQEKADYWDCAQTGCSNFDPTQKGGPCETCTAKCCADPTVISGYSCCALGCACGSDTGGCHSSSTPC
jgi:hypothetical protein